MPSVRLVAVESARATILAAVAGGCLALGLNTVGMLVAGAQVHDVGERRDALGLGILAASAICIVVFGLLYGYVATWERLALARWYAELGPKDRRLRGTVLVRGQMGPSPYGQAQASTVVLGSFALLGAITCLALAAGSTTRRDEFTLWAVWSAVLLGVVGACAAGVWWLSVLNRRWALTVGSRLAPKALGHRGPAVRISSRAQRRAARKRWSPLDWWSWVGGLLVAVGAVVIFLGVFLRQPGLYAEPTPYGPGVERAIDIGTVVGGVLIVLGLVSMLVTGAISCVRIATALRRPEAGGDARLRTATTTLSSAVAVIQAWWMAAAVFAVGWWIANGGPSRAAGLLLALGWLCGGLVLLGARVGLQWCGPRLRNRFGYVVPTEADGREFPDITLFGQ